MSLDYILTLDRYIEGYDVRDYAYKVVKRVFDNHIYQHKGSKKFTIEDTIIDNDSVEYDRRKASKVRRVLYEAGVYRNRVVGLVSGDFLSKIVEGVGPEDIPSVWGKKPERLSIGHRMDDLEVVMHICLYPELYQVTEEKEKLRHAWQGTPRLEHYVIPKRYLKAEAALIYRKDVDTFIGDRLNSFLSFTYGVPYWEEHAVPSLDISQGLGGRSLYHSAKPLKEELEEGVKELELLTSSLGKKLEAVKYLESTYRSFKEDKDIYEDMYQRFLSAMSLNFSEALIGKDSKLKDLAKRYLKGEHEGGVYD